MAILERTLVLTSPRMKGEDVKAVQDALFANPYGSYYPKDEPQHRDDYGTYGVRTADAASEARYYLGHVRKGENGYLRERVDERLWEELTGVRPLTADQEARRKKRLDKDRLTPGKLALKFFDSTVGEHESPGGSNKCPTTAYWGFVGAWCLMHSSRCYIEGDPEGGGTVFRKGSLWAYNPTLYAACRAGHDDMMFVSLKNAEPGDLVQFNFHVDSDPPDHVALFVKRNSNGTVRCGDGNWGDKADYNDHPADSIMDVIRILDPRDD